MEEVRRGVFLENPVLCASTASRTAPNRRPGFAKSRFARLKPIGNEVNNTSSTWTPHQLAVSAPLGSIGAEYKPARRTESAGGELDASRASPMRVVGGAVCGTLLRIASRDGQRPQWAAQHVILDPSLRMLACYDDERAGVPRSVWEIRRTRVARGGVQALGDENSTMLHYIVLTTRTPRHTLAGEVTLLGATSAAVLHEWERALTMVRRVCMAEEELRRNETSAAQRAAPACGLEMIFGRSSVSSSSESIHPSGPLELVERVLRASIDLGDPDAGTEADTCQSAPMHMGATWPGAAADAGGGLLGADSFIAELPEAPVADGERVVSFLGRFGLKLNVDRRQAWVGGEPEWAVTTVRDVAATVIQAKQRSLWAQLRVWGNGGVAQRWGAATVIEAGARGRGGRRRAAAARRAALEALRARSQTQISRCFKSYKLKKQARIALADRRAEFRRRIEAASTIQRCGRCRIAYLKLIDLRIEHDNSTGYHAAQVIKKAFFRFLGVGKRPLMRRVVKFEKKIEPFGDGLPSNREQKDVLLDMMRTTWGDKYDVPIEHRPFGPTFVLPNTRDIHDLLETVIYYLSCEVEDERSRYRVLGVRFVELIEALAAKRQQGFHFPPRLHNWLLTACAQAAQNLGLAHHARGDLVRGDMALKRALGFRQELYSDVRGAGHPQTCIDMVMIVKISMARGRYAAAMPYLDKAQAIVDENLRFAEIAIAHRTEVHKHKVMDTWRSMWAAKVACRREAQRRFRQKQIDLLNLTLGSWVSVTWDAHQARGSWVNAKQHWVAFWKGRTLRKLHLWSHRARKHRSWKRTAAACYKLAITRKALRSWRLALPMLIHEKHQEALATKWLPLRIRHVYYQRWCGFIEMCRKRRLAMTFWEDHAKKLLMSHWVKYHRQFHAQRKLAALFRGRSLRRLVEDFEKQSILDFAREGWVHKRVCSISGHRCMVNVKQWRTDFIFHVQCITLRTVHRYAVHFNKLLSLLRTHPAFRQHRLTRGWLLDRLIGMLVILPSRKIILVDEWSTTQNKISRRWATRRVAEKFVCDLFNERLPILSRKRGALLAAEGLASNLCNKPLTTAYKRHRTAGEILGRIYTRETSRGIVRAFSTTYLGVYRLSTGKFGAEYHLERDIRGTSGTKYVFEDLGEFDTETLAAAAYDEIAAKYESEPIRNFPPLLAPKGYLRQVVSLSDQTFIGRRGKFSQVRKRETNWDLLRQRQKEKERLQKLGIEVPFHEDSTVQVVINGDLRDAVVVNAGWVDQGELSQEQKREQFEREEAMRREYRRKLHAAELLQGAYRRHQRWREVQGTSRPKSRGSTRPGTAVSRKDSLTSIDEMDAVEGDHADQQRGVAQALKRKRIARQKRRESIALEREREREERRKAEQRFLAQGKSEQEMQLWIEAKLAEFDRIERREEARKRRQMSKEAIRAAREKARREIAEKRAKERAEREAAEEEALEQQVAMMALQGEERERLRRELELGRRDTNLYQVRLKPIKIETVSMVESYSERAWRLRRPPVPPRIVHREAIRFGGKYYTLTAWKLSSYVDTSKARTTQEADHMVSQHSSYTFQVRIMEHETRDVRTCIIYEDELAQCIDARDVSFLKCFGLFHRIITAFRLNVAEMAACQHLRIGAVLAKLALCENGVLIARLPMLAARRRAIVKTGETVQKVPTFQAASSFVNGLMRQATVVHTARRTVPSVIKRLDRNQLYIAISVLRGFSLSMHDAGFRQKREENCQLPMVLSASIAGERAGPKRVFADELLGRISEMRLVTRLSVSAVRDIGLRAVRLFTTVLSAKRDRAFVLETLAQAMYTRSWRAMEEIGVCIGMDGKAYMQGEDLDTRTALFTVWSFCSARTMQEYAQAIDGLAIPELQDANVTELFGDEDIVAAHMHHSVQDRPMLHRFAELLFKARNAAAFNARDVAYGIAWDVANSLNLQWLLSTGTLPRILLRVVLGHSDAITELSEPFIPISWQASPAKMAQVGILRLLSIISTGLVCNTGLVTLVNERHGASLCSVLGIPAECVSTVLAVLNPSPREVVVNLRHMMKYTAELAIKHIDRISQAQLCELEALFAQLCRVQAPAIYCSDTVPSVKQLAAEAEAADARAAQFQPSNSMLSLFRVQRSLQRGLTVVRDELLNSCNVVANNDRTKTVMLPPKVRSRPGYAAAPMAPNCILSNSMRIGTSSCLFAVLHFSLSFEVRMHNRSTRCDYVCFFHEDELSALLDMKETGLEMFWMLHDRLVCSLGFNLAHMCEADRPKLGALLALMLRRVEEKKASYFGGCLQGLRCAAVQVANQLQQPWAHDFARFWVQKSINRFVPSPWKITKTQRIPNIDTLRIETIEDTPYKEYLPHDYFEIGKVEQFTSRLAASYGALEAEIGRMDTKANEVRAMLLWHMEENKAFISDADSAIKGLYAELDICHIMEDILYGRMGEAVWKAKYIKPAAVRAKWNKELREPSSLGRMFRDIPGETWIESPVVEYRIIAAGKLVRTNQSILELHLRARARLERALRSFDVRRQIVVGVLNAVMARLKQMLKLLVESLPLLRGLEARRWEFEKSRVGAAAMKRYADEAYFCRQVREVMSEFVPALGHHRLLEQYMSTKLEALRICLLGEGKSLSLSHETLERKHRMEMRVHKRRTDLRRDQRRQTYNKVSQLTRDWDACRREEFEEDKRTGEEIRERERRERELREAEFAKAEEARRRKEAEDLLADHEQKKEEQEKAKFLKKQWKKVNKLIEEANANMVSCGRQLGKYTQELAEVQDFKAPLMQARMLIKKATGHAGALEGFALKKDCEGALVFLQEANEVLEPVVGKESVYKVFDGVRDRMEQVKVMLSLDGMVVEVEQEDEEEPEDEEPEHIRALARTAHGTFVQAPRPRPPHPLVVASKMATKVAGEAAEAVLNYFGPFDKPRLANLYHWPSERAWLPLATPAKKKFWRERDAAMLIQAAFRGRWLRRTMGLQRWDAANAQRALACFRIQGLYRCWAARRVAVAMIRAQFTRTYEHHIKADCYKRQTTGEETYKKPFLLGLNEVEMSDTFQRKQHQLQRLGEEPPDIGEMELGLTVQVSVPGHLNIVGANICKINRGTATVAVELAPGGPLSVIIMRDLRISDTDVPRILRWAEPHGDYGTVQEAQRHGGLVKEQTAVLVVQSLWRLHLARVRMAKILAEVYTKRLDPHTGNFYYENTRRNEVSWDKPIVLASRTFGIDDVPLNDTGFDRHARILTRFFRMLHSRNTLYETDAIDALLFSCARNAPDLTVYLAPRQVLTLAQMQVEKTKRLLLEREQQGL